MRKEKHCFVFGKERYGQYILQRKTDIRSILCRRYLSLPSVYIRGEYKKSTFLEGYADQTMVSAIWQIEDQRLEEVYAEIMEKYGKQVKEKLTATIRITSSDVAASGANIFYSLMEGKRKIALGTDMRMRHNNFVEFQQFTENLLSTFECYKSALKGTVEKRYVRILLSIR